jgi:Family of unknown function (DUF6350)
MGAVSEVWTRPLLRRDEVRWGSRVPWLAALLAAGWSLVAGLALASLPALVGWIGDGADAPADEPIRLGATVWLAAHRVGLTVDGAVLQLAPGALSVLIVLLLYRAARWAAHVAGVETPAEALTVAGPAVAAYAAGGSALALLATSGDVTVAVAVAPVAVWTALIAATATGYGVLMESGLTHSLAQRLPSWQRAAVRGAAVAVAGLLATGAALMAASAVVHAERVGAIGSALEPDVPGIVVLGMLTAAIVPNFVVWGASFALGPGFAVGAGTSVSPAGVDLGLVPALPALGLLPADDLGAVGWLILAGPVIAGMVVGDVVRRRMTTTAPLLVAGGIAVSAAVAGLAMAILAWLSGGSAGVDRLAVIGPVPWQVGAATVVLIGLPALAVALSRSRVPAG